MLFWSGALRAAVIDRLELFPEAHGETEIVVWFAQRVAVQSYNPKESGRLIRIYFQLLESGLGAPSPVREVVRGAAQGSVPRFVVSYPEIDGAMSVAFDASVSFRVGQTRPNGISIFVRSPPAKPKPAPPESEKPGIAPRAEVAEPRQVPGIPDVFFPGKAAAPSPPVSAVSPEVVEPRRVPGIPDQTFGPKPPPVAAREPAAPPPASAASSPPPPEAALPPSSGISTEDLLRRDAGGRILQPSVSSGPAPPERGAATVPSDLKDALDRAKQESAGAVNPFGAVPLARLEEAASELLARAKKAIEQRQFEEAVRNLSQLLNLPANASSREGLELIGLAREQLGEFAKARAEYELFLRLYPDDAAVPRVKARLAALPAGAPSLRDETFARPARPDDQPWHISGGISQNYYAGNSHIEILTPPPPGLVTFGQQTLSFTDQRALVTNVDVTGRSRYGGVDTRVVLRDTYTKNFLAGQSDVQRLTSAYLEQADNGVGYQYRLGRQSGTFGIIGLFDGAYGSLRLGRDYRVNAAFGEPTQFIPTPISRTIGGLSLEKVSQLGTPGGSLYLVRQTADGYIDRQALGTEVRYFNTKLSTFALFDYDVVFHSWNIFTAQANYRLDKGTNFHALGDWRKAPFLMLTNALPAVPSPPPELAPSLTVRDALINSGLTVEELRQIAKAITAQSRLINFGVNHPFSDKWQVGADVNLTSISGTTGAGIVPPQPSSGTSKTYSLQLIANNVLLENNVDVVNLTYIEAPTYTGQNYSFNHVSQVYDRRLRLDFGLRLYYQDDKQTETNPNPMTLHRTSPTLRFSYRLRQTLAIEGEAGSEAGRQSDGLGNETKTTRRYWYLGYRWDLL